VVVGSPFCASNAIKFASNDALALSCTPANARAVTFVKLVNFAFWKLALKSGNNLGSIF